MPFNPDDRNYTPMKRLSFIIFCSWLATILHATEFTRSIEIVELDRKLVGIIIPFLEYTHECDYNNSFSKNNILHLSMKRPPEILNEKADKKLSIEFFPDDDELNCYQYDNPQYMAYLHLGDSVLNIYITMDAEVMQTWSEYQDLDILTPSGNYTTITLSSDNEPLGEYDPPSVTMWYRTSLFDENKHGYYVEWNVLRFCF